MPLQRTARRGTAAERQAELNLPAESAQLGVARRFVRMAACEFGLGDDETFELEYAVNEAVTNAIRHGSPDRRGRIRLSATIDADRLQIEVRDSGTFLLPELPDRARERSDESGRGFELIDRFVDWADIHTGPDGTAVRIAKTRG